MKIRDAVTPLAGRLAVLTLLLGLCLPAAGAREALDRIVAVAGQEIVLASELEREVDELQARFYQRGQGVPPREQLRRQALERLVMQRLQLSHAERVGLRVDDATLDAAIERIAARNNLTRSQLRDALARQGRDFASFREGLREEITIRRLQQSVVQQEVEVTPEEVDAALETAAEQGATEYRVAHIRVGTPEGASPEALEQARRRAERLRRQALAEGADFATLARTFSDAASASDGGKLGWRLPSQLPQAFGDVVPGLEAGEVSPVVQAADGFHIIKLLDSRREGAQIVEETRARHILLETGSGVTDRDAEQRLRGFRERIRSGEASFAELARAHSDDEGTASGGGDLGWVRGGELAAALQERVEALEPGEISEPFRSRQGWHLVRVEQRRELDKAEEQRRARISRQIRQRKSQEALEQWLRKLREEAYVDYRLEGS
ncbi:molecular chaperone SurA [Halorhodospira neutriphila]|uniref:Chaperone SurA n=1 Tax=Halorhodospira neutriphila TaxID=168379 RepID=A0ABS1E745_9GAMM|nr:molecular chaperone SurA [Halorhodospira neutriphila]